MASLNPLKRIRFLRFFGFGVPIALFEAGTIIAFPFPYGWRDAGALLFAAIGWHPIVGTLKKSERKALLVGAVIPAIPPTFVLGAFILGKPFISQLMKLKKDQISQPHTAE